MIQAQSLELRAPAFAGALRRKTPGITAAGSYPDGLTCDPHASDFRASSKPPRIGDDDDSSTGLATRTRTKTKKPSMYKVLMLNDDYTPMEFVVLVLQRFFRMDMDEATQVMLQVHQRGVGVCGTYSYEVAEMKATQVMDCARENRHPLQCTVEKA